MAKGSDVSEDIRDIFCKYKEKQKVDLVRTLSTINCECGHKSRIKVVQTKLSWYRKMAKFYQAILAFITIFFILTAYSFWAARRYNRARNFGNGACVSTFFWTYDECSVSF